MYMRESGARPSEGKYILYSVYKVLFLHGVLDRFVHELWTGVRISGHSTCRRWHWGTCLDSAQVCPPGSKASPGHGPLIVIIESLSILRREHRSSSPGIHLSQVLYSIVVHTLGRRIKAPLNHSFFFLEDNWQDFFNDPSGIQGSRSSILTHRMIASLYI